MSTHATKAKPFQACPNVGNCRESPDEFGDMYSVLSHMYTVEQSIGMNIINRSFPRYRAGRLPGRGVQSATRYEIPGFRIVTKLVVPDLTIARLHRIEGGKIKKNNATVLENRGNQKSLCRRPRAIHKAEYHRQRGGFETERPKSLTGELPIGTANINCLSYRSSDVLQQHMTF